MKDNSRGPNCKLAANVEKNLKLGGSMHFDSRNILALKGKRLEVKGQGQTGHKGHLAIRSHI